MLPAWQQGERAQHGGGALSTAELYLEAVKGTTPMGCCSPALITSLAEHLVSGVLAQPLHHKHKRGYGSIVAARRANARLHALSAVSRAHPNPAKSIEQKNNQTMFKKGAH